VVQEIRDVREIAFPSLVSHVNANSSDLYQFVLSPRTGRTRSKEQYGYIYKYAILLHYTTNCIKIAKNLIFYFFTVIFHTCKQWRSYREEVGALHTLRGASLGVASTHFIQPFKNAKNAF